MFIPLLKNFPRTMLTTLTRLFTQPLIPIIITSLNPNHLHCKSSTRKDSVSGLATSLFANNNVQLTQIIYNKLPTPPYS